MPTDDDQRWFNRKCEPKAPEEGYRDHWDLHLSSSEKAKSSGGGGAEAACFCHAAADNEQTLIHDVITNNLYNMENADVILLSAK